MSPKESYRETLLEWIGELKDKDMNEEEQVLLKYLYQMLVNEWYEEHFYKDVEYHPDQKKPFKRLT